MGKNEVAIHIFAETLQVKVFFPIDWLDPCNKKKFAHKQSYQTISVLVCILDDMGNSGSIAEIITHLETPLVGVKTNNCWTRKNDKTSSQMIHQPPVVPLARLSSDTTRNRPHHRSARARNIILDRQEAWEEVFMSGGWHRYENANLHSSGGSHTILFLLTWRALSPQSDSLTDTETQTNKKQGSKAKQE